MLGININGAFMKSAHNAFYEIFRKMELWTGKYFPIFLFYRLIQDGYDWPVKSKFYDAPRNRVRLQNCRDEDIRIDNHIVLHKYLLPCFCDFGVNLLKSHI